MTLHIRTIRLRNFRLYEELDLDGLGRLTVFAGRNAAGKTSILEGIRLLTALSSFRSAGNEQLIRSGAEGARLSLTAGDGERLLELDLAIGERGRRYRLNGKAKRPADLKGLVPSVSFTPDDLELMKGPMAARRRALDVLGSQLSANYHLLAKDYEKVLRHRNRLLKDEAPDVLLDSMDELAVKCGSNLSCYRASLHSKLKPLIEGRYREIAGTGEALSTGYAFSWDADAPAAPDGGGVPSREEAAERMHAALRSRRAEERARRRSLVGPHADTVSFSVDGRGMQLFGSQGQQRTAVLSWKLAEAELVEDTLGCKAVLLLDDVMSELDSARREALVAYMAQDVQTFITTANLAYFDEKMLAEARVVSLPRPETA